MFVGYQQQTAMWVIDPNASFSDLHRSVMSSEAVGAVSDLVQGGPSSNLLE